jgi:NADH dehydrogenase FAD-containing subunit
LKKNNNSCLKIVDSLDTGYRVLCVSTKNYFLFTPMLASSSVGTIEFRSIVEPIRDANPTVSFIEGSISDIDPANQTACIILKSSTSSDDENDNESSPSPEEQQNNNDIIEVSYDVCVYACGVQAGGNGNSISKVPGVSSTNCHFLKDVSDALRLRISVGNLLERASRPGLTDNERRNLLHFVVVGGGATGVEYIGELTDFLRDVTSKERKGAYALLSSFTSITLVHGGDEILPQFDKPLRTKAVTTLTNRGVDVRLNTRVAKVESPTLVKVYKKKDGDDFGSSSEQQQEEEIHCGIIVWAAGTAPVSSTERLLDKVHTSTKQKSYQGRIPVDPWLRVIGSPPGTLFALGDASVIVSSSTSSGDSHDGQQQEDDDDIDGDRKEQQQQQEEDYILPQTAQVAAQQGAYMARLLNRKYCLSGFTSLLVDGDENYAKESTSTSTTTAGPRPPIHLAANKGDISSLIRLRGSVEAKPFRFLNLGLLAFLGGGEALSQIQFGGSSGSDNGDNGGYKLNEAGSTGFLLWRSVYIVKQVSTRTRVLVLFDWLKCKLFGRDVTRL